MVLRYNSGNKGGIRLSKFNYSYHRFLNNNRNKGIPNLMLWICIGNALAYFLSQFGTPLSLYSALSFDPQAIAHGQVWRLFSYIFTFAGIGDMSIYSIFSVALALYCSYWPARYLEQLWGSLRVNLYYLIGILAMDVYAMLVYFLFHVSYGVSALYLNLSMFLSVAALMPEARGLLFFFIPVKMRWLALVDIGGILYYLVKDILEAVRFWTLYGSALLGIGLILVAFLPVVAQLPCLLFCWHELPQLLPLSLRRHASRAERKRRAEFRPRRSSSRTPTGRRIIRTAPESAPTAISALCAAERIRNTRTLSSATARSARAIAAIASIISITTFIFSETAYRAVGERHAAPVREAAKAAPIRRNAPPPVPHSPDVSLRGPEGAVAISGRQLRFRRGFPVIEPGTARLPRRFAPRNDKLESP